MKYPALISHQQWLEITTNEFSGLSQSAALDARVLLCHCLQKPLSYILTWPERKIPREINEHLEELKQRRLTGEPMAYLTGVREFWSMTLNVNPDVLIPRPETELLVEWALERIGKLQDSLADVTKILELGTGSGAIAIALSKENPSITIHATDCSVKALKVAIENASANECKNIIFINGHWFEPVDEHKYALIISNPPYVAIGDPHLKEGDLPFEPYDALVAKDKGLSDIQSIITRAKNYLHTGGWLGIEHGYEQAFNVQQFMVEQGYDKIQTMQDLAGRDRVSVCQWNNNNER